MTARVIAIDGPAGSGKSTVARTVAAKLGLDYLDTGAMYRSVAWAVLHLELDPVAAAALDIEVGERIVIAGHDVTGPIRGPEVSAEVSRVAAQPSVREQLVRKQRAWVEARSGGVIEGRDIGTVVFPDADLKVFLTASEEERARRRSGEAHGVDGAADVARRDRMDSTRAVSPLTKADDAIEVDTTGKTIDEVVDEVLGLVG